MVGTKIRHISISGLNNVKNGSVSLEVNEDYGTSILGVYGQNGSGKTTLIDALHLLKFALMGGSIPDSVKDYINNEGDHTDLSFDIDLCDEEGNYQTNYQFRLKKILRNEETDTFGVEIANEKLSYSYHGKFGDSGKEILINTDCNRVFIPDTKYKFLFGTFSDSLYTKLTVIKEMARRSSQSFIFCPEFLETLSSEEKKHGKDQVYRRHAKLIHELHKYGTADLQIVTTRITNLIGSTNQMPIQVWFQNNDSLSVGRIMIPAAEPTDIPEKIFGKITEIIENINIVLKELIPGMQVKLKELGRSVDKDGQPAEHVQLVSVRNGKIIPFYNESEGIRKIFSILQLLIAAYNDPHVTVAVDELDNGIFEYLLGEILKIFSEEGKGQLIFTSHNLRALEILDRKYIAFSTINPEQRYVRMKNIKSSNNLRDMYYHAISIGSNEDLYYKPTDDDRIALAMHKAGKAIDG